MVHVGDQQRIHMVGQSNKGKHVSFEDVAVVAQAEAQKYVSISEVEVRTIVEKEKCTSRDSSYSLPFLYLL